VPCARWFEDPNPASSDPRRCGAPLPASPSAAAILLLEHIVSIARLPACEPGPLSGGRRVWRVPFDEQPPFEVDAKGVWFLDQLVRAPYQRLLVFDLMPEYQRFYSDEPHALTKPRW
jgi:hypothetical protein